METKPLLYGLAGFFIGGLLVAIAANTFDKAELQESTKTADTMQMTRSDDMTMSDMTSSLKNKTGDNFDKTFMSEMIVHHQGAIDMAKLAQKNAKHQEVKDMANDIVNAQSSEITQMRQWQTQWDY